MAGQFRKADMCNVKLTGAPHREKQKNYPIITALQLKAMVGFVFQCNTGHSVFLLYVVNFRIESAQFYGIFPEFALYWI